MKVNRQEFLHVLESIQAGISEKPSVEQSDCFVFQDGFAFSFNGEICCKTTSLFSKQEMKCAVHGQPLLDILKKLIEEEIEVEQTESHLVIRGDRRKVGIRLENKITLPIDKIEPANKWKELHEDFSEAVKLTQQCCGKDDSMWVLTCIHITPHWMESSNHSHHLCRYQIKTGVKEAILVKPNALKHIISVEMSHFSETQNWIHFKNSSNLIYSCRRTVDTFPDFGKFLKVTGGKIVLPKGLGDAVDKAMVFSELSDRDDHEVMVDIHPNKGIRVRGEGASGYYQEIKSMDYKGEFLSFLIKPDLLIELTKSHQEAIVNGQHLMVDNGKFRYVTCLRKVEETI